MNISETQEAGAEHQYVWSEIPWYVNASIGELGRAKIDSHLAICAACREEVRRQRLIQRAMAADSGIDHISSGSLNRLRLRLDEAQRAGPPAAVPKAGARRRALLAAAVGTVAIAVAALTALSHRGAGRSMSPDNYYTVSSPVKRAPDEVIRAVFVPNLTVAQLQNLLDEAHLKIVGGPTEAGVYSLATTRAQPVGVALSQLRRSPDVRFAESTAP